MADLASAPKDKKTIAMAAAVIGLACLGGLAFLPKLSRSNWSGAHGVAPVFALPVVANGDPQARISLADLKGKPVLIDFWAYWCGPCRAQAPIVEKVADRYRAQGLQVVGVSVDGTDEQVNQAVAATHTTYPIVDDPDRSVQASYHVTNLPTLILIDRDGNVANVTHGLVDASSLDAMVRETL